MLQFTQKDNKEKQLSQISNSSNNHNQEIFQVNQENQMNHQLFIDLWQLKLLLLKKFNSILYRAQIKFRN